MGKKIQIGDIVEIRTSKGLAYAQYTHKHKDWGALLRILPKFFETRPLDFSGIVLEKESFVNFFPLQAAVNRKIFEIVSNEQIPPEALTFPLFRGDGHIDRHGKVHNWYLWDGIKDGPLFTTLTDELRKLPKLGVCNDTLLIQRIEEGWTPENDPHSQ